MGLARTTARRLCVQAVRSSRIATVASQYRRKRACFAADTSPQLADIRPAIGEFLLRLGIFAPVAPAMPPCSVAS